MALNTTAKNTMVNGLTGVVGYLSAHTADPGATGTNEVSGSPYARAAVAWGAASGGSGAASAAVNISIPGGVTVAYVGLWSAASGGTFYGAAAITAESFGASGTLKVTAATISAT